MEVLIGKTKIIVKQGDITNETVDVIVNAANSGLAGGGGVDGAIHQAGGPEIGRACKKHFTENGRVEPGYAVATTAGDLDAQWVVHAVGPKFVDGQNGEYVALENAYVRSLAVAKELEARTIAFPSISTGTYRFPVEEAALVVFNAFVREARDNADAFDEIRMVTFSDKDFKTYCDGLTEVERTMIG